MKHVKFAVKQIVEKTIVIFLIVTILYFLFRLMPGSYADKLMYQTGSQEAVDAFRRAWGLDEPLYVQYLKYMRNLITFNAGYSLEYGIPVWDLVKMRLFNTIILLGPAITVGYILGSVIGTYIGTKRGSLTETGTITGTIFLGTMPEFFVGILLVIVFAGWLNLFPTSGMLGPGVAAQFEGMAWWRPYVSKDFWWHYTLPFLTIVIRLVYFPTLIMRTSVVETLGKPFVYYHKLTGISKRKQIKHVAHHSIIPVITVYPMVMVRAVSGSVLVEIVFNWPGIGNTLVRAVFARDFPVIIFIFFLAAVFIVVGNFIVDVMYGVIDPRISIYDEEET